MTHLIRSDLKHLGALATHRLHPLLLVDTTILSASSVGWISAWWNLSALPGASHVATVATWIILPGSVTLPSLARDQEACETCNIQGLFILWLWVHRHDQCCWSTQRILCQALSARQACLLSTGYWCIYQPTSCQVHWHLKAEPWPSQDPGDVEWHVWAVVWHRIPAC